MVLPWVASGQGADVASLCPRGTETFGVLGPCRTAVLVLDLSASSCCPQLRFVSSPQQYFKRCFKPCTVDEAENFKVITLCTYLQYRSTYLGVCLIMINYVSIHPCQPSTSRPSPYVGVSLIPVEVSFRTTGIENIRDVIPYPRCQGTALGRAVLPPDQRGFRVQVSWARGVLSCGELPVP